MPSLKNWINSKKLMSFLELEIPSYQETITISLALENKIVLLASVINIAHYVKSR